MRNIFSVAALLAVCQAALADAPDFLTSALSVSEVSLSSGDVGDSSRLRLTITNEGNDAVTFMGVRSDLSQSISFTGWSGEGLGVAQQETLIAPEETLSLSTSHLQLSLETLNRPLVAGEALPLVLQFSRGELRVIAHVHP